MNPADYPIEALLPHSGPMLLIDEVLTAWDGGLRARTRVRCDGLIGEPTAPGLPAWMGLEYLAQTIAAWSGWRDRERGEAPRPGFLVGTRRYSSSVTSLPWGGTLEMSIQHLVEDREGVNVFDGRVEGDDVEQTSQVKVFLPRDLAAYLEQMQDG